MAEEFVEELVPCSEQEEGDGLLHPSGRRPWVAKVGTSVVVTASVFVGLCAFASRAGRSGSVHVPTESFGGLQGKEATWEPKFPSQCGTMEIDMNSNDESGWGTGLDHIPNPETCCALCQGIAMCQSFTWVKDAGLDGCPSQCWLKGGIGTTTPKQGYVSGAPPRRKMLGVVPDTKSAPGTTLFCFSLMVPNTMENKLLAWQAEKEASIFACDSFAVYSNVSVEVGSGVRSTKIDSDLQCGYGGDSGTALNAWIFIALLDKLLDDGEWAKHDWSVKADPDAVFFPDRLVRVLKEHQGAAYINNCKYGMHGPIEVFGKPAMAALDKDYKASWDGKAPATCVKDLEFGQWGEDMFLDQCLQLLKVGTRPLDERLMCEDHCDCPSWYWCNNGTDRVSYHPFKTVQAYANCMANAGINP